MHENTGHTLGGQDTQAPAYAFLPDGPLQDSCALLRRILTFIYIPILCFKSCFSAFLRFCFLFLEMTGRCAFLR